MDATQHDTIGQRRIELVEIYEVPVDPMDDLQCDSCQ
jgi:hypothetical protein